ncbi:MAG: hypothetical protein ACK48W_06045 [Bacteroidota bacterium]
MNNITIGVPAFSRLQTCSVCILGLLAGMYFYVFKVIGWDFAYYPGDLGDGRFNMYILEHAFKFLIGKEKSLWDAPFMFPEKNIITYSDNLIGTAPLYGFFRILGSNRELSFQYWFVFVCSLNYFCGFVFLNSVFKNPFSAALGAFVFAFTLSLQSQMSHAQTFPRFAIPIAFLMIYKFYKDLNIVYLGFAIFALVFQFYCAIYLGFLLSFPLVLAICFVFVYKWETTCILIKEKYWLLKFVLVGVFNLLLLLPLMIPYYERSKTVGLNYYENIFNTLPTIGSYFFSQKGSLIWDFMSTYLIEKLPSFWEHQLFSGAIATLCFIGFLLIIIIKLFRSNKEESKFIYVIFFTSVLSFIFFLRINNISLYAFLFKIPGFASLRCLTRIINIQVLFLGFSVSYVFTNIWKQKNKFKYGIFLLFFLLLIIDSYFYADKIYKKEKSVAQLREARLIERVKNLPKNSVVSYEPLQIENSIIDYQIDAMLATQTLDLNCLNGYTSTSPPNYGNYWEHPDSLSRMEWLKNKDLGIKKICVIH